MPGALESALAARVESTEIISEPFPHLVVPDLFPAEDFRELSDSIPPLEAFEQSQRGIKADLPLAAKNTYFAEAPEDFRRAWGRLRDDVFQATIAPILARRFEAEIREKYADLLSPELADAIMADGLVGSDGRIMSRKPGYHLKPHLDSAHFAVTCLLYFTTGDDEASGALCLFRPERTPELREVSTYYPESAEGISVTLAKEIPTQPNLFVAFLNTRTSLHGVRIDQGKSDVARLTYQSHVLPRTDVRKDAATFAAGLADPEAAARWGNYVEKRRAHEEAKARAGSAPG